MRRSGPSKTFCFKAGIVLLALGLFWVHVSPAFAGERLGVAQHPIRMMLRLDNVSKIFADGTRALNGVSLKIEAGEFVVILDILRRINREETA